MLMNWWRVVTSFWFKHGKNMKKSPKLQLRWSNLCQFKWQFCQTPGYARPADWSDTAPWSFMAQLARKGRTPEAGANRSADRRYGKCHGVIWNHGSIDWFNGKITGKSHISWENLWFPVDFPLNQPIEWEIMWNRDIESWYGSLWNRFSIFIGTLLIIYSHLKCDVKTSSNFKSSNDHRKQNLPLGRCIVCTALGVKVLGWELRQAPCLRWLDGRGTFETKSPSWAGLKSGGWSNHHWGILS